MTIEEILKLRQEAGGINKLMHMHVVTLDKDGGATVELDLTPELLNPLGMALGGTIFTLCDIAAGSAAASQGTVAVTLDSTIHYYRPGRCGKKLTAVAYERKRGRKVSVYMVEVHDDEGKHIADATFTMFYTGATLDDAEYWRVSKAIVQPLLDWYDAGHRDLPWQSEPTPYRVWVARSCCSRRVEAVRGYFPVG